MKYQHFMRCPLRFILASQPSLPTQPASQPHCDPYVESPARFPCLSRPCLTWPRSGGGPADKAKLCQRWCVCVCACACLHACMLVCQNALQQHVRPCAAVCGRRRAHGRVHTPGHMRAPGRVRSLCVLARSRACVPVCLCACRPTCQRCVQLRNCTCYVLACACE